MKQECRFISICIVLLTLLVVLFVLDLCFGSVSIPLSEWKNVLNGENALYSTIVKDIRLPKAITSVWVGVALSVSGLVMQTFFRNPLAGPYVLGVSSGATLGVALFFMLFSICGISLSGLGATFGSAFFAMMGSLLLFLFIVFASLKLRDSVTLLIVGMMMGMVAGAFVTVLQNLSDPDSVKMFVNWTLGSLSAVGWNQLLLISLFVTAGLLIVCFSLKSLDALLLGESYATTLGVSVRQVRFCVIAATVLMTGITTAFTGPIGFVGIAVPHVARVLLDTSVHRKVFPCSILMGACVMLACDIVSQLPQNGYVLPINAVTALVGIPVVLWIVLGGKRVA